MDSLMGSLDSGKKDSLKMIHNIKEKLQEYKNKKNLTTMKVKVQKNVDKKDINEVQHQKAELTQETNKQTLSG
jgi:hypothetical protein